MIAYDTVLPLTFLKKSRFTGSERGMRYCIRMTKQEEEARLCAEICPGPFSVDKTKRELFTAREFPFSEEGKREAIDWMNAEYQKKQEFYEEIYDHPGKFYKLHHIEE